MAVISALVFGAVLIAWVPLHVSAVTVMGPQITEHHGAAVSGPYEPIELEIQAEGAGTTLRLPAPVAAAVRKDSSQVDLGGWRTDPDDPDQVLSEAAAVLRINGSFNSLDFAFQTGPHADPVVMRLSGAEPFLVELREPQPGTRVLTATSGHSGTTASRRFAWQPRSLPFGEAVDRIEGATFGSLPVSYRPILSSGGQVIGVHITQGDVLRAVAGMAGRAVPLVLLGMIIAAVALGFGTLLEMALRRSSPLKWAWPERFTAGMATGMAVLGALNYYAPVSSIIPILLLVGAAGLLAESKRGRLPRWECPVEVAVLTGFVLALVTVPLVITDRWAIGHLQTDVHDTFNLTQLFWSRSALDAHTDFGNGFRLLDYSVRAAVAGWARPSDAVVILRIISTAVMVPLFWTLAGQLSGQRLIRLGFAGGISLSAPLLGLYAEGYMTREFFATWMMIGVTLLIIAVLRPTWGKADWAPAAAAFAVAASVVPPYFILAPAVPLLVLLARLLSGVRVGQMWKAYSKPATGAALVFIIAAAPNLLWVRKAGDAQRYIPALNALARNTVVPFYDSVRFPVTLVGGLPFHANDAHYLGSPTDTVAPGALLAAARFVERPAISVALLSLVVTALAVSALATVRRPRRDLGSALVDATWLSLLAVVVLGFVGLRITQWDEQTYFVMMWAWTLAPVGVLLIAIGLARTSADGGSSARTTATVGLVILMLVNSGSSVLESTRWLEDPRGSIASRWHFDLVSDLVPFSRALDDGTVSLDDNFQIVETTSALTGTDDDRVLANVLVGLLVADGHRCVNCRRTSDTFNLVLDDEQVDLNRASLVIGGRRCPGAVVYQGDRFVLCDGSG